MKRNALMRILAVMLAGLSLLGFTSASWADPNYPVLETYSRSTAWSSDTHALDSNTHGSWSYWYLLADDRGTNGRGDSSVWNAMGYLGASYDYYQFYSALPTFGSFQAYNDRLSNEWNKGSSDPCDLLYMGADVLAVFTVPETGGYNIVGDLTWSCEHATDCRAYALVGTIKQGETSFNTLFESVMLRDADNLSPYENIDPANPVAVPGYAGNTNLVGVNLEAGDQIVFVLQNGLNYRKANLHDGLVEIERTDIVPVIHNRAADWAVDTHGGSGHGQWGYYSMTKANADTYGLGNSSYWVPGNYEYHYTWYSYWLQYDYPDFWRSYARENVLYNIWNKDTTTVDFTWREGYFLSVFTADEAGSYKVTGDLLWSNDGATDTRGYVKVGYVKDGIFNSMYTSEMLRDADNLSPYELIPETSPVAVPGFAGDPILNAGVNLDAGDQIVIAMQNGVLNSRGFMLHDSGVNIEQGELGPDEVINRAADFSADTHDSDNSHGNWSYWSLTKADRDVYGRGDTSAWQPLNKNSTIDRYDFFTSLPDYVFMTIDGTQWNHWWNKDATTVDFTYREADMIAAYDISTSGVYNIGGSVQYDAARALTSGLRFNFIVGRIPAGSSSMVELFTAYCNDQVDGPFDVPGYEGAPALQNVQFDAGDKLVFIWQSGAVNYREGILYDSGIMIERWPVGSVPIEFNRATDWMASGNQSGNSHGTAQDPVGDSWEYWIKPFAHDRLDYLPGELQALPWSSANARYELIDPVDGYWQYHSFADSDGFETFWNYDGEDVGKESWVVATFRNPYPGAVDFDISGETTYEKERTADTSGQGVKCEIAVINSDFTSKSVAWSYEPSEGAVGVYPVPDPGLTGITLQEGEYIAIAFRGNRLNYRNVIWHNSALTISPDTATFKTLTVAASPSLVDSGIVPAIGASQYLTGQVVDISAADFAGACPTAYMFDRWEVDGVLYSTEAETTITMDADKELTAVFVESTVCGDVCRPYPETDLSEDCVVDLADFALLAGQWQDCTDPSCD